jgi:sulfite oxidase
VLGAAYAGEGHVAQVDVSVDDGATWQAAEFIGPDEPYAWRQWQYVWQVSQAGEYSLRARARDDHGSEQPPAASWNYLGYGNNGIEEHAVRVSIL